MSIPFTENQHKSIEWYFFEYLYQIPADYI